MIPREILKKIRQIELRTNRLVNETLAGCSLQSLLECRGVSRSVKHRQDGEGVLLDREVDAVFVEPAKTNLARATANFAEHFRACLRSIKLALDRAQASPEMFRKVRGRARKIRLRRFDKYSIYFAMKEDVFAVLSVFHAARNPAELQQRLK